MRADGLPDPGPRPEAFTFPFAAASAALAAIEEAVAELQAMVSAHDDAVGDARIDFEGETRRSFDRGFAQLMNRTDDRIRQLQAQRDDLADDIVEARRRREANLDATAEWGQAVQRYQEAQASGAVRP